MDPTYLHLQTTDKPLFSDIIWSRPERRSLAGKLALIGGSSQGFNSVSLAYTAALNAGVGVVRTLFPDALKRVVSSLMPESEFAPSTKTGSFSSKALGQFSDLDQWADVVMISGDLGHNSETAVLLERYLGKKHAPLAVAGDTINILSSTSSTLLSENNLLLGIELTQLQKLLVNIRFPMAVNSQMTMYQLAELLHALTQSYAWAILTEHLSQIYVSYKGEVSVTPAKDQLLISASSAGAVWLAQQPSKPFEALSSGIYELVES